MHRTEGEKSNIICIILRLCYFYRFLSPSLLRRQPPHQMGPRPPATFFDKLRQAEACLPTEKTKSKENPKLKASEFSASPGGIVFSLPAVPPHQFLVDFVEDAEFL